MSSSPSSSSSSDATPAGPFAWLGDVPCRLEAVLGTGRVKVRECLAWHPDVLVRLDQTSGAELELRVEGIPLAAGEVIVTDATVGVRVVRILPPAAEETA